MFQRIGTPMASAIALACVIPSNVKAQAAGEAQPLPPVVVETQPAPPAAAKKASSKKKSTPSTQTAVVPAAEPEPQPSAATELGSYNPALDLPPMDLPAGTTITTAGPVYGYQAFSAFSSTKTATPIEQIPQSIQVIPRSIIEDQNSLTVSEAIQNASNVQGPNSRSLGNSSLYPYTIRGFGAQAWLDGMVMPFSAGDRDSMVNIERIEILKGPNAILYGGAAGAPIGGAVNIVSKLPTNKASSEFGFTFGSQSYIQPYFDINQPIASDGTVLFRITGEYTGADSFVDVLEQDRYSISPTLTLTNKTDTTLIVQGRFSRAEQQTYQGLPVTGTIVGDFRIDPKMFIGPADIPRGYSEVKGVTVSLDHRFDDVWSGSIKARWSEGSFEQNTQTIVGADYPVNGVPLFLSTWGLANSEQYARLSEFSVNPNANARFVLGASRNILTLGADYSRVKQSGYLTADVLPAFVDLTAPTPLFPPYADPVPTVGWNLFNDVQNIYTTKGAYAQIQSSLYERVHLLAGVRAAKIEVEQVELALGFPTETVTDAYKALPRAGIVVDLLSGLSAYASYSEGMQAVARQRPTGISPPEYSQQREIGFKYNFWNELSGTVSYFEIDRDNVEVLFGFNSLFANQKADGFEVDTIWQPNRNWQVLASYGYTNAVFADDLLGVPAGNKFPYVPAHSGRLWVNYTFDEPLLQGWSVGAGIYAASGSYVDNANLWKTDSYFTVDAKVGYENDWMRASFNVKNLTGEEYFVPYAFLGGQVAPGDDRAYYGTFAYKY